MAKVASARHAVRAKAATEVAAFSASEAGFGGLPVNAGLRISVVVSTYNQPAWLEKCLWSLLGQSHGGFEVIVDL